jgi:hypothetical protein
MSYLIDFLYAACFLCTLLHFYISSSSVVRSLKKYTKLEEKSDEQTASMLYEITVPFFLLGVILTMLKVIGVV